MPELPEVEVTRRSIEPLVVGRTVSALKTGRPSYFFLTRPDVLRKRLVGRRFTELSRHGKYLLFGLDDDSRLLLHLGMTGQLFSSAAASPRLLSSSARSALAPEAQPGFVPDLHTHLQLIFRDRGPIVFYRDVRKFGKCAWLAPGKLEKRLAKLGVDALAASPEELHRAARRRGIPIKTLLLDQSVLAGVGNIYADEALFLAKIRPTRPADRVSHEQCVRLVGALKRVLLRSIETGGSSISDYIRPDGSDGGYQDERHVYGRTDLPCRKCRTPIRRVVIGQRSAHYCASCQR